MAATIHQRAGIESIARATVACEAKVAFAFVNPWHSVIALGIWVTSSMLLRTHVNTLTARCHTISLVTKNASTFMRSRTCRFAYRVCHALGNVRVCFSIAIVDGLARIEANKFCVLDNFCSSEALESLLTFACNSLCFFIWNTLCVFWAAAIIAGITQLFLSACVAIANKTLQTITFSLQGSCDSAFCILVTKRFVLCAQTAWFAEDAISGIIGRTGADSFTWSTHDTLRM
jgi:hypothetical protein